MKKKFIPAFLLAGGLALSAGSLPLVEKVLTTEPSVISEPSALITDASGFKPAGDYSVEFKLKSGKDKTSLIKLFGETGDRKAWTVTVGDSAISFVDPTCLPSPDIVNSRLNSDRTVTLRLGVTTDSIYIFRNGIHVGTRSVRYTPLPQECTTARVESVNILRNGDFESKDDITYNVIKEENDATCLRTMDAWFIYPNFDVWNSRAFLQSGSDGNCLRLQRYSWSSGDQWTDGIAQQAVNVVGGTPYTFSFMAYGGEFDGKYYGYAKLEEVESGKSKIIDIKNTDAFEKYTVEYTPSAGCSQLRVIFGVRFPGALLDWGEVPTVPLYIDNVSLSGLTYSYHHAAVGYETAGGSIVESMTLDESGAYAPVIASITTDTDKLIIDASQSGKATAELKVTGKGLAKGQMISVISSSLVNVSPAKLPYNANGQKVRVSYEGTRTSATDTLIIKSGETMHKVALELKGKALEQSVLAKKETPSEKNYSVPLTAAGPYSFEIRAKVKAGSDKGLKLYAAGKDGLGFGIYVADSALTADNAKSRISNPLTLSSRKNSDMAHTYRVAVSGDRLIYVYRDGNPLTTLEASDFIIPAEFATGTLAEVDNLLVNPDFDDAYSIAYVEDGGSKAYVDGIQGWDIYPIEPWNTRQYITKWEISESEGYDKANNALLLQRYGWNAGFSDGLISQAVNVVGGTPYTLDFLAAGGIHQSQKYAYVRIEEVADPSRGATQTINSENPREYKMSYTPSASCSQLRVVIGLKSPGAIGSWGSVPEVPVYVDKLVLKGMRAVGNGTLGFVADKDTEIEYFAYDMENAYSPVRPEIKVSEEKVRIDKTNGAAIVRVSAGNLNPGEDISVICPDGVEAAPKTIRYDADNSILRIMLKSQKARLLGNVILRSGTTKAVIKVDGRGTPLPEKMLDKEPLYTGSDESWTADGFNPGADGYTVEFRAMTEQAASLLEFTAVDASGAIRPFASGGKYGVYNGADVENRKVLDNTSAYHTYRYAVTADRHVFVYYDGTPLDTLRVSDYAVPASVVGSEGKSSANLLNNPGFEGSYRNYSMSDDPDGEVFCNYVEGWTILDANNGWNSRTYITPEVVSDAMGDDNHVLEVARYQWEDGWSDSKISQVVNVVPGTPYKLSAMAMGGFRKSDDTSLGYIRIEEVQTPTRGKDVKIAEKDRYNFGRYELSFTPSAKCTQLRVVLGLKKAGKGNETERVRFDDIVLSGKDVTFTPQLVMRRNGAKLEYFTFDATGAYAPNMPHIDIDAEVIDFPRTLAEETITVSTSDVKDVDKIELITTGNFIVEPEELVANTADSKVTVTFTGTSDGSGSLLVKAGTFVKRVELHGTASDFERKDISANPVYTGAEGMFRAGAESGFNPGKAGYTVELAGALERYSGGVFELCALNSRERGVNLVVSDEFTATSPEIGNVDFITGDMVSNVGDFVYRVAVSPDNMAYVFKDGELLDTVDLTGIPADIEFIRDGESVDCDNLVRNGKFNGAYSYTQYEEAYMLSSLSGWYTSGIDEWNARAYVVADADSPGENIINLQRYDWNPGWADAVISQVVNVVPGETYTFSAEVRGGSEKGHNVAFMNITEVENGLSRSLNVSNASGDFSTRTISYKAGENCHQLKLSFSLASTGVEGNGPKCSFYVKNVSLSGKKPLFNPGIILKSDGSFRLKYFTYDLGVAYFPAEWSGVDNEIAEDPGAIRHTVEPGLLTVSGITEGACIRIYNLSGTTVAYRDECTDYEYFNIAAGYYIVNVVSAYENKTFKVFIP